MPATVAERLRELSQHDRAAAFITGRGDTDGTTASLSIAEFRDHVRNGFDHRQWHQFAIAQRSGSFRNLSLGGAGEFLVERDLVEALQTALNDYSSIRRNATILTRRQGQERRIPLLDDLGVAAAIIPPLGNNTETALLFAAREMQDFQFATPRLRIGRALLQDAPQLATAVFGIMGQRMARGQNAAFTTGIGDGVQPLGIVNAPVAVTTASSTAIAIDELLALAAAIPDVYRSRPTCKWMMNGATWLNVMSIKDGDGRPIWKSSALSNWQIEINANMPSIGAGAVPIVFGDLSTYVILDVGGLRVKVLDETYAELDSTGFETWAWADGTLADPSGLAIQSLRMHS